MSQPMKPCMKAYHPIHFWSSYRGPSKLVNQSMALVRCVTITLFWLAYEVHHKAGKQLHHVGFKHTTFYFSTEEDYEHAGALCKTSDQRKDAHRMYATRQNKKSSQL